MSNKKAFIGVLSFDISFFIGIGFFLYSFLYLLEKTLKSQFTDNVKLFSLDVSIAILAFLLGNFFTQIFIRNKLTTFNYFDLGSDDKLFNKKKITNKNVIVAVLILAFLLQIYMNMIFGGWATYFTQVYGEFKAEGINSFTVIIPLLCSSFVLFFNSPFLEYSDFYKKIVLVFSLILIIIFLFGGNRNLGMMIAISLLWSKFFRKKFNFFKLIPILFIGLIVTSITAIGRQYGLINYLVGSVSVPYDVVIEYVLSVSNGEFGTMARVMDFNREFNFHLNTFPGYSYFVDPIVTLIPTVLWENRPHTVAVEFTKQYWGSLGEGTEGLGFSPILEAKLNFSFFWPLIFMYISSVLKFLELYVSLKSKNIYYYLFGSISAVSLNFFRIDFAITFKFAFLVFVFALVFDTVFSKRIVEE
ncbi:O-antigen polymerase [Flavobacterium sp.]|jgi:hypothetical protein|uniref:O-antigen polymerase n=1 Tax=Flavobacterium sp. TaxID=239 RepID=UPI0022BC9F4B|nr:O-antigen polymerase [Flavobacterium sp.]MCZ8230043.1 O-antigen ligase [Flavobacterium sp.]